jgi:hypothetical protein
MYIQPIILKFLSLSERPDLTKTISDLQTSNQWQSVQQPYFTPDSLPNVIEKPQESQPHRARALSDKGQ